MITPRQYQKEAHDSIFKDWETYRATLLEMATGTGKTIVFSMVAQTLAAQKKRCLILAHRDELIRQAVDKLSRSTGLDSAIEKADERGAGSMFPIVTASVQTLCRIKRLESFHPDEFAAVIVDEAHHALAQTYQSIFNYFTGAKILGVTATPDRGDKKNLGQIFDNICFKYGLRQAVLEGNLCKITAQTVPLKINLGAMKQLAGDYSETAVGSALEPYLCGIAEELSKRAAGRKTLVFLPLRVTSRRFCELLRGYGMDARHVDGESEDRDDVKEWLATPGPKICCNAMLYTEGFDEPSIDCVVPLRVTKSRSLYAQMIGRGTRLFPGKADLLLLDFLWQTEKHDLCRPCHLVAERAETMRIMEAIQEKKAAAGIEQIDLFDLEELANTEEAEKRHKALAEALKAQEKKKSKLVDPLLLGVIINDSDLSDYEPTMKWERAAMTDGQRACLPRFGINPDLVKCKGHATMLIGKMIERRKMNLASLGKIAILAKYGFEDVGGMTDKAANIAIDRIKENRWNGPERWFD